MATSREEVFESRVSALGLSELMGKFRVAGVQTHQKFAFGVSYNPSMPTAEPLDKWVEKLSDKPEHWPSLRFLWFESWALVQGDMKREADATEHSKPRKLSLAELKARRAAVVDRLPGLTAEDELDVSNEFITKCVGMHDRNLVVHLPLKVATKRVLEVTGAAEEDLMARTCDLSDYRKIDLAFKRRGLGMNMADLVSFERHEELRIAIMNSLSEEPPEGYAWQTIKRANCADEAFFALLAKFCDGGVRPLAGVRPMDAAFQKALVHPKFTMHLAPLPAGAGKGKGKNKGKEKEDEDEDAPAKLSRNARKRQNREAREKKEAEEAATEESKRRRTQGGGRGSGGRGGGGGGSGRGRGVGQALPPRLVAEGNFAETAAGERICWAFNLDGCQEKNVPPGGTCSKGKHVCVKRSCGLNHGYSKNH